jgi:hypothetical protein
MLMMGMWIKKYNKLINWDIKLTHVYYEEFFFYVLFIVIRAFIMAVMYGFTSKVRAQILSKADKGWKFVARDLLIPSWYMLSPQTLKIEVYSSIWKNHIEENLFMIAFVE